MTQNYDAIVIGGGPSGSTAAALLAEQGHRVLLLERELMPRYHIGESLIPYTWFTLNRLGLVERATVVVDASGRDSMLSRNGWGSG